MVHRARAATANARRAARALFLLVARGWVKLAGGQHVDAPRRGALERGDEHARAGAILHGQSTEVRRVAALKEHGDHVVEECARRVGGACGPGRSTVAAIRLIVEIS